MKSEYLQNIWLTELVPTNMFTLEMKCSVTCNLVQIIRYLHVRARAFASRLPDRPKSQHVTCQPHQHVNNGSSRRLRINGPRCGLSEWHNRVARIEDAAKAICDAKCARGRLRITPHKAMVPVFLPRAGRGQEGRASLRVSVVLQV